MNAPLIETEERAEDRAIQRQELRSQPSLGDQYIAMFFDMQSQRQDLWDRLDKANEEIARLQLLCARNGIES